MANDQAEFLLSKGLKNAARIAQLDESEMAEKRIHAGIRTGAPWGGVNELSACHALESILSGLLAGYPHTLAADEEASKTDSPALDRRQMAVVVRLAEKRLLSKGVAQIKVMRCEEIAKQQEKMILLVKGKVRNAGAGAWSTYLTEKMPQLEGLIPDITQLTQRLGSSLNASTLLQATSLVYFWLVDGIRNKNCVAVCHNPATWPKSMRKRGEASLDTPTLGGPLRYMPAGALEGDNEEEFTQVFAQKMVMWGAWLLSQWAHTEGFSLQSEQCISLNSIGQESVMLRQQYAWSVPAEYALDALAAHAPLVELGAGNGVWAQALLRRGVDVTVYDTPTWDPSFCQDSPNPPGASLVGEVACNQIQAGGPEAAEANPDRSLVLMWPDYGGLGSYGLQCVEQYAGKKLVLIGEWHDRTYGAYSKGISKYGQSFSQECQAYVEDKYDLVEEVALPNWPLFLDVCRVWQRKAE